MTTSGNLEDIERQLRSPATSFRELLTAGSPFVQLANAIDAGLLANDTEFLRFYMHVPTPWPTVGDLRKLRDALVAAGWKPGEEF